MPNWVKAIVTIAVCYVAVWFASLFLNMGDGSEWE